MTMLPQDRSRTVLSIEARLFAEKTARSIAEIQSGIVNVSDVVTFLEVLGYNDKDANKHGFSDLLDLANYIITFIDKYEDSGRKHCAQESHTIGKPIAVPSIKSRLVEAVAVQAPWLGALIVLNLTGVSLWMARDLPHDIATMFVGGVFAGLIFSEALLQMFSRLLFMYFDQTNLAEVKRILLRSYLSGGVLVGAVALVSLALASIASLPVSYALLFIGAAASVVLHRLSFNLLYTLRMVKNILGAYASGLLLLVLSYYLLPLGASSSIADRYFISLAIAFAAVSAFSVHGHIVTLRRMSRQPTKVQTGPAISFYRSQSNVTNSLKSRFGVQALESIPQFVSGLFFYVVLFGDRILAWIFNPHRLIIGTYQLHFAFNNEYHSGADIALFVLIPAAILQYLLISPLYAIVHNRAMNMRLRDFNELAAVVNTHYRKALLIVLSVVGAAVIILNLAAPALISMMHGTNSSLEVLRVSSIGNLGLAILTTNIVFLNYLNRAKLGAILVVLAATITLGLGAVFAQYGVAHIAYGYLISSAAVGVLSTFLTKNLVRNEFVRALARFS